MKSRRFILASLGFSLIATAIASMRAAATPAPSACGPWDYCLCIEVGCYMGNQMCASGPGFVCYQF